MGQNDPNLIVNFFKSCTSSLLLNLRNKYSSSTSSSAIPNEFEHNPIVTAGPFWLSCVILVELIACAPEKLLESAWQVFI